MQSSFSRPGTAGARSTRPVRPSTSSGRLSSSAKSSGKIKWGGGSKISSNNTSATQKNWPSFSWTRPGDKKATTTTAAATGGGHAPPRIHLASNAGRASKERHSDLNVSGSGLRSPTKASTKADSSFGGGVLQASFASDPAHESNSQASSLQASSHAFGSGQPFADEHARAISVLQKDIKILQSCFSATSSTFSSTVDKTLKRYIATTNPEHNEYAAGKLEEVLARCTSELLAAGQKEQWQLHHSVQERRGRPGTAAASSSSTASGDLGASIKEPSGRMLKQIISFVQHTGSLVVEHGELLDRLASEQRKCEELRKTVSKLEEEKDLGKLALISNKMRSPTHEELERAKAANATVDPLRFSESGGGNGKIGLSISTAIGTTTAEGRKTLSAGGLAKNAATSPLQPQTRDQATVMSPNMLKISQPYLHAPASSSSPKKKGKHHHHHSHKHKRTSSSSTSKRKETDESVDFVRRQRDAKEKELGVVKAAERKLFDKCSALDKELTEKTNMIEQLTKKIAEIEQAAKKAHTRTSSAANEKVCTFMLNAVTV